MITDYETEVMEKSSQLNRVTFELNSFKSRFTDLEI